MAWLPEVRALPMRLVQRARMQRTGAEDAAAASVSASACAAADSLIFQSHYRRFPLLPGVYLIDAALQALRLAYAAEQLPWPVGLTLQALRLARVVGPGELLQLDAVTEQLSSNGDACWVCTFSHDAQRVARFTLRLGQPATVTATTAMPMAAAPGALLDAATILQRLPHRPPILLVDRATVGADGRTLQASKAISLNEPCYQWMDDDAALDGLAYPVALLAESFIQSCGLLITHGRADATDEVMILGSIGTAIFHADALPGDHLRHELTISRALAGAAFVSGHSWVGERHVASYEDVMVAMRPAHVLRPATSTASTSHPSAAADTAPAAHAVAEAPVVP